MELTIHSVKRIEVVTGAREVERVEEIFHRFEIEGYMIHKNVEGKGNLWVPSPNELTGEFEDRLITAACAPEKAERLLGTLETFVQRYGGACIAYDAQCTVS